MNIEEQISDFLRDAQYKLALMTAQMDSYEDIGDVYYSKLVQQRRELNYFYSILYSHIYEIDGGYNFLEAAGWTESDILNEIHYLRNKYELNGLPAINYGPVTNVIEVIISGDGGTGNVPEPTVPGQILISGNNGWELGNFNEYAGMADSESLDIYFSGRP